MLNYRKSPLTLCVCAELTVRSKKEAGDHSDTMWCKALTDEELIVENFLQCAEVGTPAERRLMNQGTAAYVLFTQPCLFPNKVLCFSSRTLWPPYLLSSCAR